MAKQITQSEFEKKQKELAYLKKEGREDIAQKLQEARSHGDLSENAEYDEARNDQAKLEEKISQLERELDTVEVVSDDFFEGDQWLEPMAPVFSTAKPLMDFMTRVIDDYE